jgi:OCT family organic cation transporter-like MFS transporter 4/5
VILHILLVATSFVTYDLGFFYALVFFMGIEQTARFLIGYIYLSEFCAERTQRPLVTTAANLLVALTGILCALYFKWISKSWLPFEIVGLLMAAVSLCSVFFMPESPRWLIAQGKYKQALKVYKRIAKVNGKVFTEMIFRLSKSQASEELVNNLVKDPNSWVARGGSIREIVEREEEQR